MRFEELDVVELSEPVGEMPAGSIGAIVSMYDNGGCVEFLDHEGYTVGLEDVLSSEMELAPKPHG